MKLMLIRNLALLLFVGALAAPTLAQRSPPPTPSGLAPLDQKGLPVDVSEAQIVERLGQRISIEQLQFTDEQGEPVKLSQYFNRGKPVVVAFVYYECPSLCTLVLNGMVRALKDLSWTMGDEFELVTVSMDHEEGPELAAMKKEAYLKQYGRLEGAKGWHFLTGAESQVRQFANELGFGFKFVEDTREYAHSAGLFVLTPDATISRVLYGVEFSSRDLRLSLVEAGQGKIGTIMDRVMMFCYRYDPSAKGYALQALRVVQAGGAFTLLIFGGYLAWFWAVGRRRNAVAIQSSAKESDEESRRSGAGG